MSAGDQKTVEELLDELQRESEIRRAELREIAAELPVAMSRRVILRRVASDIRTAPQKGEIITRALRKFGRGRGVAARWLKRTVTPSAR